MYLGSNFFLSTSIFYVFRHHFSFCSMIIFLFKLILFIFFSLTIIFKFSFLVGFDILGYPFHPIVGMSSQKAFIVLFHRSLPLLFDISVAFILLTMLIDSPSKVRSLRVLFGRIFSPAGCIFLATDIYQYYGIFLPVVTHKNFPLIFTLFPRWA